MDEYEDSEHDFEPEDSTIILNVISPKMVPLAISERVIADMAWRASKLPQKNEFVYNLGLCLDTKPLRAARKAAAEGENVTVKETPLERFTINSSTLIMEKPEAKTPYSFSLGVNKATAETVVDGILSLVSTEVGVVKEGVSVLFLNEKTKIFEAQGLTINDELYTGDVVTLFRSRADVQEPPNIKPFVVRKTECINEVTRGTVDGQYAVTTMDVLEKDQFAPLLKTKALYEIPALLCKIRVGPFSYDIKYFPEQDNPSKQYTISLIMNLNNLSHMSTLEDREERTSDANTTMFFNVIQEFTYRVFLLRKIPSNPPLAPDSPIFTSVKTFLHLKSQHIK